MKKTLQYYTIFVAKNKIMPEVILLYLQRILILFKR